ncbi:hypothetical protein Val02_12740 [Virgisporangium aliadipatigenens]|uniref:NB-ARC domain-containing protein n=1 Tax=Virgisporangium aliadipatigenens TaxID=741659 RepID=A0A8J3YHM9_9ACTN|nr:tetratricopeptide repeat protein [Virgisporangium aliadipatigenens]GIJ44388.1 hypothetical protein Val02_12740 [Virgisporangium aliadipatigenens]
MADGPHADLPDPGAAGTVEELTSCLRALKVYAGDPSFTVITERVNRDRRADGRPANEDAARGTVVDCFKAGRRRLDPELVVAVVRALHGDPGYVNQWRQALRVAAGQRAAASQVRVFDALPPELAEFTGRRAELAGLDTLIEDPADLILSIEGMPGVGKTQLAVRMAHRILRRRPTTRVLYVNLRGFHPDPVQPSADPAAVLDAFLRLLGVPGNRVPHESAERHALFRDRLADRPTLLVLDDAADEEQVRRLLADVPGCITLITSRRRLARLTSTTAAVHAFPLDVFTVDETWEYLVRAVPRITVGVDPSAVGRLAQRCGGLPLALRLVTGHMRGTPGWTVTDHADRLDERHAARRIDSGIGVALAQSYQSLPPGHRSLFRMLALHPGPDLDRCAAVALADLAPARVDALLHHLEREHLVRPAGEGRFVMHDLVRAYAAERGVDEDSSTQRRDALGRLLDHYTSATIAAMDTLHPADAGMRRRPETTVAPIVAFPDAAAAKDWLDTELPVLVAVSDHAAEHGLRRHAVDLSVTLFRYLSEHPDEALRIHGNARDAARAAADAADEAAALVGLGAARCIRGDHRAGAGELRAALGLFRSVGDRLGEARALMNLGSATLWQGDHAIALEHMTAARALFECLGATQGVTHTLTNIAYIESLLGRHTSAVEHLAQAIVGYRGIDDVAGEAIALTNLANAENALGETERAVTHFLRAAGASRRVGDRTNEADALEGLAGTYLRLGDPARAVPPLRRALDLCRRVGYRRGEANSLTLLGDVAQHTGDRAAAMGYYLESLAVAGIDPAQRDRAEAGLRRILGGFPQAA